MAETTDKNKIMRPEKSTLKKRGQITIPKSIREILDLQEEDQLEMTIEDGKIVMQPIVTVAKDQTWFWTSEWQKGEREAESDIRNDRVNTFDNSNDAIAFLHSDED